MRRIIAFVMMMVATVVMLGKFESRHYTCSKCDKKVVEAYYDCDSDKESVMCEHCAKNYWISIDYKIFRVE